MLKSDVLKLRNFGYLFLLLLGLWLLLEGSVYALQKRIIFQAVPLPTDHVFDFEAPYEEYFLEHDGGGQLNALYFSTSLPRRGAILYFHGNADNLQRWGQYQDDLTRRGYDVFMIDYRGYGKSDGQPDTETCYRDARLAYDWLRERFAAAEIILYGRSLGSAMASQLASTVPARLLILETPFDNIQHSLEMTIPTLYLPWDLRYPFANDRYLAQVPYPIYIFHGTKDRVVPYRSAICLKPLLQAKDHFYTIPDGGHKNLSDFALFQESLEKILLQEH